jgi:hypothetical protein
VRIERRRLDDGETRYSAIVHVPSTGDDVTVAELRIFGRDEGINEVIYLHTEPLGARRAIGPLTRSESAQILASWRQARSAVICQAEDGSACP